MKEAIPQQAARNPQSNSSDTWRRVVAALLGGARGMAQQPGQSPMMDSNALMPQTAPTPMPQVGSPTGSPYASPKMNPMAMMPMMFNRGNQGRY